MLCVGDELTINLHDSLFQFTDLSDQVRQRFPQQYRYVVDTFGQQRLQTRHPFWDHHTKLTQQRARFIDSCDSS